jgi:hypothetical protein
MLRCHLDGNAQVLLIRLKSPRPNGQYSIVFRYYTGDCASAVATETTVATATDHNFLSSSYNLRLLAAQI